MNGWMANWLCALFDSRRGPSTSLGMTAGTMLVISAALSLAPVSLFAQTRPAAEFQLSRINNRLVTTPQLSYSGGEQFPTNQRDRWLTIEAEFTAVPEVTDELTFRYYVLLNGKLLTGEVTHTNIVAGRENRSVMFVPPKALARFLGNRPVTQTSVQNIAVQIVQQGAVKDELSLARAQPQWFAALPQLPGFLLNKNETPFAPLYWDRYEQIKAPAR